MPRDRRKTERILQGYTFELHGREYRGDHTAEVTRVLGVAPAPLDSAEVGKTLDREFPAKAEVPTIPNSDGPWHDYIVIRPVYDDAKE